MELIFFVFSSRRNFYCFSFFISSIELISYIFKPISLSVRLFANMMAGHTLLKVIAGFAWSMLSAGGLLFIFHTLPLAIIVILLV